MKTAAAREKCDWDWRIRDLKGTDPYSFILEEVQESRGRARLLTLKARVEIADRRYDEAIEEFVGYSLPFEFPAEELLAKPKRWTPRRVKRGGPGGARGGPGGSRGGGRGGGTGRSPGGGGRQRRRRSAGSGSSARTD